MITPVHLVGNASTSTAKINLNYIWEYSEKLARNSSQMWHWEWCKII